MCVCVCVCVCEREREGGMEDADYSLLDVVLDKLDEQGQTEVLDRMVLAGRTRHEMRDTGEVGALIEGAFASEAGGDEHASPSGFLLVYPEACVVVLEGSGGHMGRVVRRLQAEQAGGPVSQWVVVAATEDIPRRRFPAWLKSFVKGASQGEEVYDDNDNPAVCAEKSSEVNLELLEFGRKLDGMSAHEVEHVTAKPKVRQDLARLLPSANTLRGLVESTVITTLDEFCDIFYRPVDIVLDDELAWPVPQRLQI